MLRTAYTGQFKKDFRKAVKRGCDPRKLERIVTLLCNGEMLPEACRDHALVQSRNYKNMRICHIEPDWLLVYQIVEEILVLRLIRMYGANQVQMRKRKSRGKPQLVVNLEL